MSSIAYYDRNVWLVALIACTCAYNVCVSYVLVVWYFMYVCSVLKIAGKPLNTIDLAANYKRAIELALLTFAHHEQISPHSQTRTHKHSFL